MRDAAASKISRCRAELQTRARTDRVMRSRADGAVVAEEHAGGDRGGRQPDVERLLVRHRLIQQVVAEERAARLLVLLHRPVPRLRRRHTIRLVHLFQKLLLEHREAEGKQKADHEAKVADAEIDAVRADEELNVLLQLDLVEEQERVLGVEDPDGGLGRRVRVLVRNQQLPAARQLRRVQQQVDRQVARRVPEVSQRASAIQHRDSDASFARTAACRQSRRCRRQAGSDPTRGDRTPHL